MLDAEATCVYQFKIVLRDVSPMVWRRLLLRSDQSIADLHYAIQIAMDWSDQHLNCFHIHGKDYGVAHIGGMRSAWKRRCRRLSPRFFMLSDSSSCRAPHELESFSPLRLAVPS